MGRRSMKVAHQLNMKKYIHYRENQFAISHPRKPYPTTWPSVRTIEKLIFRTCFFSPVPFPPYKWCHRGRNYVSYENYKQPSKGVIKIAVLKTLENFPEKISGGVLFNKIVEWRPTTLLKQYFTIAFSGIIWHF